MKLSETFHSEALHLKNHMVMSAMTRCRAGADGVPGDLMRLYYRQRAGAGLIISEAINISADALGSPLTPGIFTPRQIEKWTEITAAVHECGGKIFAQLWHCGRVAHSIDRNGVPPGAPSAVKIEGMQHFTSQGMKDYEAPRELSIAEIHAVQADYVQAAKNALKAGFDGVELHAANGYLPQQFFADSSNRRSDAYGGSRENRARFILETVEGLVGAAGGARVGIKISPLHVYAAAVAHDPVADYHYLLSELQHEDLAFIEIMKRSPVFPSPPHYPQTDEIELFGRAVKTALIAGGGYTRESGEAELCRGIADLIAYGQLFLANPDLPARFAAATELNQPDFQTFFTGGEKGYTDYPFLSATSGL